MKFGKYQKEKTDFLKYITTKFHPFTGVYSSHYKGTCGTFALSTLTGLKPRTVSRFLPKAMDHWTDRSIVSFLKNRGYEVIPITVCSVTGSSIITCPITRLHVLLIGQYMTKGEGSWQVVYNNKVYHNFGCDDLNGLEFVNSPIMTAYTIFHPKWKMKRGELGALLFR